MKNRVIYTDDKIYVFLSKKINNKEFILINNKINFIKSNYNVSEVLTIYYNI